ncbi:alcohol dehydrogenase catalytic domain-containing protein [Rhizobacter sp. OV335]|uniref:alcohol dehydrogenase catalytic domain-containing protein n=1 Tax=Rhizobacter sp. OV335 TaxID=1500264 RepID=UPI001161361D|nr:alcohol dehydrogenase catalytic domain-containing protein [Rhizobacter sp. OV335]
MSKIVRFHKVEAVGLNHSEGAYFHGTYVEQPKLPSKLGYEARGVVEAVGHGVDVGLIGAGRGARGNNFPLWESVWAAYKLSGAGFGKGLALRAYVMMEMWASSERMNEAKRYIYERLEDGRFTPKIARTFSFADKREAFAYTSTRLMKAAK